MVQFLEGRDFLASVSVLGFAQPPVDKDVMLPTNLHLVPSSRECGSKNVLSPYALCRAQGKLLPSPSVCIANAFQVLKDDGALSFR